MYLGKSVSRPNNFTESYCLLHFGPLKRNSANNSV